MRRGSVSRERKHYLSIDRGRRPSAELSLSVTLCCYFHFCISEGAVVPSEVWETLTVQVIVWTWYGRTSFCVSNFLRSFDYGFHAIRLERIVTARSDLWTGTFTLRVL